MTTAIPPRSAALRTYDATDNGDGTFTIHDVEIVGPMPKGEKPDSDGKAPGTDRDWMERVIANHLAQLISGYVAPVHDGHHGITEKSPIGTFVPMAVRTANYEGESIPVLVGDVTMDSYAFDEVRRGRWPYRSIEVATWGESIITSLAFMSGAAPYWRFPMLKSVRVINAASVLPGPTMTEAALTASLSGLAPATGFRDVPVRLRARALARLEAIGDEDGDEPPAKDESGGGDAEPTKDDAAANEDSRWAKVMVLLSKIFEAVAGRRGDDSHDPPRDDDPEESGDAPVDEDDAAKNGTDDTDEGDEGEEPERRSKEKARMSKATTTLDADPKAALAALATRVTTLETEKTALAAKVTTLETEKADLAAKVTAGETAAKCSAFVAAGEKRLRAKRVIVPADFATRVSKLYAKGEDVAEELVAALESGGRMDPPETLDAALAGAQLAADAPEFSRWIKAATDAGRDGAAALEACRKVARKHRDGVAMLGASNYASLETMLAEHFRSEGAALVAKSK